MLFSCGACRSLDRLVIFPPNVVFGEQEMQLYGVQLANWQLRHTPWSDEGVGKYSCLVKAGRRICKIFSCLIYGQIGSSALFTDFANTVCLKMSLQSLRLL